MSDVDVVAEAMWLTHTGDFPAWAELPDDDRNLYRALAQAAIDALQLTQEQRTLADGMGGISTNYKTGETTVVSKPCTRQTRLVTPWMVTT